MEYTHSFFLISYSFRYIFSLCVRVFIPHMKVRREISPCLELHLVMKALILILWLAEF